MHAIFRFVVSTGEGAHLLPDGDLVDVLGSPERELAKRLGVPGSRIGSY
jgi:hypothetical protein